MLATRRAPGDIRVKTPDSLRPLLAALQEKAGAPLYLVGGAVRDLLRNEAPADLDFAVEGDAGAVARRIADALDGHVFAMDESRGQMRVVLDEGPVREIDIAPLKGDIDNDLRQRDFTVDAMAALVLADGELGEIVDPLHGAHDVETKTLRLTGESALQDDPLRLLRAVRLTVELGFEIEADTASAVRMNAALIHHAAAERQRDELVRIFATDHAAVGLRLMDDLGLLAEVVPELMEARGIAQPENHHYYDVFDHSIEAVAALDALLARGEPADARGQQLRAILREGMSGFDLESYLDEAPGGQKRRVLLKLAGLLHDVSKPETKTTDATGRVRFLGHPEKGARKAAAICRRVRFGNRDTSFVALLVDEHLRPTMLAQRGAAPSQRALYRFFRDLGDAASACLVLQLADGMAAAGPRLRPERFRANVAYAAFVLAESERLRQTLPPAKRIVTGNDLMTALGLDPGPELGRLIEAVEEAIGGGEVTTKEEALEYAAARTSPPAAATPSPRAERGIEDERSLIETVQNSWQTSPQLWVKLKLAARQMRQSPTPAEDELWESLRRHGIEGFHFRRQHVIGRFVVDFYCSKARLAVEVDGPVHLSQAEADVDRTAFLTDRDIRVLRFDNARVMSDLDGVLAEIRQALLPPDSLASPSPLAERGTEGERYE